MFKFIAYLYLFSRLLSSWEHIFLCWMVCRTPSPVLQRTVEHLFLLTYDLSSSKDKNNPTPLLFLLLLCLGDLCLEEASTPQISNGLPQGGTAVLCCQCCVPKLYSLPWCVRLVGSSRSSQASACVSVSYLLIILNSSHSSQICTLEHIATFTLYFEVWRAYLSILEPSWLWALLTVPLGKPTYYSS